MLPREDLVNRNKQLPIALVNGTHNSDFFFDHRKYELAELESAGFDFSFARKHFKVRSDNWDQGSYKKVSNPKFNGGIRCRLVARLEKGDRLFRFGRQNSTRDDVATGSWWFDEETCRYLWKISGMDDGAFRNNARYCFCVPDEWSDMSRLVSCELDSSYWCFKGFSEPVRRAPQLATMTGFDSTPMQIYLPGGLSDSDRKNVKDVAINRSVY